MVRGQPLVWLLIKCAVAADPGHLIYLKMHKSASESVSMWVGRCHRQVDKRPVPPLWWDKDRVIKAGNETNAALGAELQRSTIHCGKNSAGHETLHIFKWAGFAGLRSCVTPGRRHAIAATFRAPRWRFLSSVFYYTKGPRHEEAARAARGEVALDAGLLRALSKFAFSDGRVREEYTYVLGGAAAVLDGTGSGTLAPECRGAAAASAAASLRLLNVVGLVSRLDAFFFLAHMEAFGAPPRECAAVKNTAGHGGTGPARRGLRGIAWHGVAKGLPNATRAYVDAEVARDAALFSAAAAAFDAQVAALDPDAANGLRRYEAKCGRDVDGREAARRPPGLRT